MKTTTKHWASLLPDAGKPVIEISNRQLGKLQEIERLQKQIKTLRQEYKLQDEALYEMAQKEWSIKELTEADRTATNLDSEYSELQNFCLTYSSKDNLRLRGENGKVIPEADTYLPRKEANNEL